MSQTIKCPSCGELIDVDEQIRKDTEEKIRNEYNEKGGTFFSSIMN